MKKVISWILIIILAVSLIIPLTACANKTFEAVGKVVEPVPGGEKLEITILFVSRYDMNEWNQNLVYSKYKTAFEDAYGVKVKYETASNEEDLNSLWLAYRTTGYMEKLASKMYLKDGPELIYNSMLFPMKDPAIKKVVVNAKGKIPNIDNVYSALLTEEAYYIPISMLSTAIKVNKKVFTDLNINKPNIVWNKEDYIETRKQWTAVVKPIFSSIEFNDILSSYMNGLTLFGENTAKINIQEMKSFITSIRNEIFSGNYQLNKKYTYKNYYNMFFEPASDEFKKEGDFMASYECSNNSFASFVGNPLNLNETSALFEDGQTVIPIQYGPVNMGYTFNAFMINKNGKNLDLAYAFINGLLSDKTQMDIYKSNNWTQPYYPVSKEIEADIKKLELNGKYDPMSIALKEYLLGEIRTNKIQLYRFTNEKEAMIYTQWFMDITKFIFADKPYTDAELSKELQALEDKYNLILNE